MEQKYFRALWRWLWLIVLVSALAGVATYWVARNAPSTYEAEARLIVGPGLDSPVLDLDTLRTSSQLIHIYANVAQTPSFQQEIIGRLTLPMSEAELAESMDVIPFQESQVLVLRVHHSDPQRAIAIVNAAATMLMERSPTSEDGTAVALMEQITQQAEDIEDDITASKELIRELEAELATVRTVAQQDFLAARLIEERRFVTDSNRALNDLYALMREPITNQIRFLEPAQSAQLIDSAVNLKVMIGAMAGLVATMIPILGIAYYTDPIYTPHNIEQAAGTPVLAALAQPSRDRRGGQHGEDPEAAFSGTRGAEAYRAVAAKLKHMANHTYLQTILVTSGRSKQPDLIDEVSTSLAVALAQAGEQVLLVDNQPHSTLARDLVDGQAEEQAAEEETRSDVETVRVPWLPNLLVAMLDEQARGGSLGSFLKDLDVLKLEADIVIVAAPPLSTSSDGLFIAPNCDGVVLIAESGTRRDYLRQAAGEVTSVGGELLGCILIEGRARQFDLSRLVSGWQNALAAARAQIASRMPGVRRTVSPVDEVVPHD